jgi:hypothetical protein
MRNKRRARRPGHATVVAYLALFVALSGTAVASHEAIFSSDIVDGEVRNPDLAANAVGTAKIADGHVTTPDLGGSSVTSAKIATAAVEGIDLHRNSVNSAKTVDNSLTGADIDESTLAGVRDARLEIETSALTSDSPKSIQAQCSPGEVVLGGGGSIDDNSNKAALQITAIEPDPLLTDVRAVAIERPPGISESWFLKAYAICAPGTLAGSLGP